MRLKDAHGVWLDSDEQINIHLYDHFTNLFSSTANHDMEEAWSVVDHVITTEMNLQLTKAVTDDDIKSVVFQLGSVKAPGPDGYPGFFYH